MKDYTKRYIWLRTVIAGSIFVAYSVLVTACKPKAEPLPNGYGIFVASKSQKMVIDSNNSGISKLGTDLQEVGSYKEFIFGRMGNADGGPAGFFVLDSNSGKAQIALSEKEWLKKLKAIGVPVPPERLDPLKKPPTKY